MNETIKQECQQRWGLDFGEPYASNYHDVWRVTLPDETPAVLKLAPPETYAREVACLTAWGGGHAVRLIDQAPDLGAMLLERLEPASVLDALADDEAATRIAARLMPALWVEPPTQSALWPIERNLADLDDAELPLSLLDSARTQRDQLLATAAEPVVLHGDLHHGNILKHGDGWKVIDPHGLTGEPCYEVGALLRNPIPHADHILRYFDARIGIFADELGFAPERMRLWAFVQVVLSAWWSVEEEDDAGVEHWLTLARAWQST